MTSDERMLAGISGAGCGSDGMGSGAGGELPKLGKPPKLPQPASPRAKSMATAGAGPELNFPMASILHRSPWPSQPGRQAGLQTITPSDCSSFKVNGPQPDGLIRKTPLHPIRQIWP